MNPKLKGQGAIEYLLIIGAAVIIAVIVIALMMGLAGQGTQATEDAGVDSAYEGLMGIRDKYKGVMTVTLSFSAGTNPTVIVQEMVGGNLLNDIFPPANFPSGTEALVDFSDDTLDNIYGVTEPPKQWVPSGDIVLPPGTKVTITLPIGSELVTYNIDAKLPKDDEGDTGSVNGSSGFSSACLDEGQTPTDLYEGDVFAGGEWVFWKPMGNFKT